MLIRMTSSERTSSQTGLRKFTPIERGECAHGEVSGKDFALTLTPPADNVRAKSRLSHIPRGREPETESEDRSSLNLEVEEPRVNCLTHPQEELSRWGRVSSVFAQIASGEQSEEKTTNGVSGPAIHGVRAHSGVHSRRSAASKPAWSKNRCPGAMRQRCMYRGEAEVPLQALE